MNTLYYTVGLPGSGKTFWARKHIASRPKTIRANRDDIRMLLWGTYWFPAGEPKVTLVQEAIITMALSNDLDVVVDDTNLNPKTVKWLKELASKHFAETKMIDFTKTPLETCIERDKHRDRTVTEEVIRGMYERYLQK